MSESSGGAARSEFKTDIKNGLTSREVQDARARYGFNETPIEERRPLRDFGKQLWGVTAWMLELALIVSLVLDKMLQFYIILALLIFNAVLGTLQQAQATRAVKALRTKLQVSSRVLRDGEWSRVPARELVPGDMVRLRAGDFVPADLKMAGGEVEVDQSAVTGESLPVSKRTNDVLYSGSVVRRGESNALVQSIGAKTYIGKTIELVQTARPRLHMQEVTTSVVRWLLVMVVVLLTVAFVVTFLRGQGVLDLLPLALVLLISAIPVALPTMFVVSMAIGSVELARKGVLITRLGAAEDAATMDTVCVDKTGTITLNKLAITAVLPLNGFTHEDVVLYGALASNEADQDPIDIAFISSAEKSEPHYRDYSQLKFVPFDPATKRTEAVVERNGKRLSILKGAVRTLADLSGVPTDEMEDIEHRMDQFARSGYRTLAVAVSSEGAKPKLAGLVALWDPPRLDSSHLVTALKNLGISVKMLTGDAIPVAQEMARKVGLGKEIVSASSFQDASKHSQLEAGELAEESDGFAEIYPEDKYLIVKGLQSRGHVVGMTGDGVNDAPALKQAEVGIAVSNATDVAKGASSVVLTNEGLTDIVGLIQNGRRIYERITVWTLNKIIKTFEVVVFASLALILTGITVVGAFQVVLLLLVNDFVTISLSTDRVRWSKKPDTWNVRHLVRIAVIIGVLTVIEHFVLLAAAFNGLGLAKDDPKLNTFAFEMLFFPGLFTLLIIRDRKHFWTSRPSNVLALALVLDGVFVAMISTFGIPGLAPIPFEYTLLIVAYYAFFVLVINDTIKYQLVRRTGLGW